MLLIGQTTDKNVHPTVRLSAKVLSGRKDLPNTVLSGSKDLPERSFLIAASFQSIQQLAKLVDIIGRKPAFLNKMLHQRQRFTAEQ